jgi:alkanesulfonate monooxygenase SsuD/methylene tetrahydromethanopterin reductase-like flavin-dependent oxidoreductase (luciferase family)
VIPTLHALLDRTPLPATDRRHYRIPSDLELAPAPRQRALPLWIGSWGSRVGLRRVARAGDGWLASAYNTTPERFSEALQILAQELAAAGRRPEGFPNALSTMWTWVAKDRREGDRMLVGSLAPLLGRDPDELRAQVCVGSPEHCAEILARYARAGCGRVFLWPLGDERRQLERVASEVAPHVEGDE